MSTERIWLNNYPEGVPHEIDDSAYDCLVDFLNEILTKFADKKAYSCLGEERTFAEIDKDSKAFGAYLQSLGLKPGDRIALMMPNILQYPVALFGALRAGLTVVNTNPLYTDREMKHQFNDAGVKAVVIAENFAYNLEKILPETDIKHVILTSVGGMFGGIKGFVVNFVLRKVRKMIPSFSLPNAVRFNKAVKKGRPADLKMHRTKMDDMILIQYTGGTTGVAKGAMLTNRNLIANMLQVKAWLNSYKGVKEGQEIMLTPLPMYHIFSFTVNCLCMASFGALSVLIPNPRDLPSVIKVMNSYKFTLMTGVNTLFNALLNHPDFKNVDFSPLKIVVGGAMAIQGPVAKRWREQTGVTLTEGYGMTEASPVVSVNPLGDSARIGTIGLPIPSTELRIANEKDEVLPQGERGEIQVRGPQVMKGYYERPEATAKTITEEGWLKTGDVGIMSEDGFVTIVDRIKDMILVSGFNVYPNEIEDVVAGHEKVLEVAAVGVPDEKSGEAVKIFVVAKDPGLTADELRAYCKANLTGYKKPKHIEFRDELPKTNVGKILRRALRDEAMASQ